MKTKKIKWPSFILFSMGMLGLVFTLSSKDPVDPQETASLCGDAVVVTQQIQINFDAFSNASNARDQQRDDVWQGYIPSTDLRFSSNIADAAAGSLLESTKYYCVVTVTAPQCDDYIWTGVMDATNATSSGLMDIEVLSNDGSIDTFLKVEYFEVASGFGGEPQFNRVDNSRLKYNFEFEYFGGLVTNNPEPIQLFPGLLVNNFGDAVGIDSGKNYDFGDFGSVNNYIELNDINP